MRLKEVKARMEMLLSYYRGMGETELAFVHDLEIRLRGVAAALGNPGDARCC